jgi:uncharacterized protein YjdB
MRTPLTQLGTCLLLLQVAIIAGCGGSTKSMGVPSTSNAAKTSTITWPQPADVPAGTPLDSKQLNATANVPGTFTYTPPAGTVLQTGAQKLTVSFTPTDAQSYAPATASTTVNVTAANGPTLTSVKVSGPALSVLTGGTIQFTATATYSDSSTKDVTSTATWTSSSTSVASVKAGTVTGVSAGAAQISASVGGVASSPISVSVAAPAAPTLSSIKVSGASTTVQTGSTIQFSATAVYSDNSTKDVTSTATWTSSNNAVATVKGGTISGVSAGSAQIGASLDGVASSAVSVTVSTTAATLASMQITGSSSVSAGSSTQLKATGSYSDKSTKDITSTVTWTTSSTSVAAVQAGLVNGVNAGTATITATSNSVTASTKVTVTNGVVVQIDPSMSQSDIQNAINGSQSGDTIAFAAGTYKLTAPGLTLPAGRSFLGSTSGATILSGTGGYDLMTFKGDGLTLQNFTFDGGGLYLGGPVTDVHLEYNTFQNINAPYSNWTAEIAIFIDTSAANSDISNNNFKNIGQNLLDTFSDEVFSSGILGKGLSNTTIENNKFDTFTEGIHIFYDNLDGLNVHINNNTFVHGHRIAIEQQDGKAGGLEVANNTVSEPLNGWALTYGLSIAASSNSGTGISVHDNLVNADTPVAADCRGSGCYYPYGIEAWGTGTVVTKNTIEGLWSHGVSIGAATNLSVINNTICGPTMATNNSFVDFEYGSEPGTVIQGNITSSSTTCGSASGGGN